MTNTPLTRILARTGVALAAASLSLSAIAAAPAFADRPSGGRGDDRLPRSERCTLLEEDWIDSYDREQCFLGGGEMYCAPGNVWQCCDSANSCWDQGEYSDRVDYLPPAIRDRVINDDRVRVRDRRNNEASPRVRVRDRRDRSNEGSVRVRDRRDRDGDQPSRVRDRRDRDGDQRTRVRDRRDRDGDQRTRVRDRRDRDGDRRTRVRDRRDRDGDQRTRVRDRRDRDGDRRTRVRDRREQPTADRAEGGFGEILEDALTGAADGALDHTWRFEVEIGPAEIETVVNPDI